MRLIKPVNTQRQDPYKAVDGRGAGDMKTDDFISQLADFIEANSKEEAVAVLSKSLIAIARTDNNPKLEYVDELGGVVITLAEQGQRPLH